MKRFFFTFAVIAVSGSLLGQDIQVNRQNKTISVTAEESATADAEVAVLAIGYHNYGLTQDAAFQENVRADYESTTGGQSSESKHRNREAAIGSHRHR